MDAEKMQSPGRRFGTPNKRGFRKRFVEPNTQNKDEEAV